MRTYRSALGNDMFGVRLVGLSVSVHSISLSKMTPSDVSSPIGRDDWSAAERCIVSASLNLAHPAHGRTGMMVPGRVLF